MAVVLKSAKNLTIENLNRIPVDKVPIDSLVVKDSVRSSRENISHIRALAEVRDGLPPILVHRQTMQVIDGIHRLRAAVLCGAHKINVRFFDGDEASSFVVAVLANVTHGLPLSLADRKAAAARAARYYPEWSDRAIASLTGLSHNTVAVVREGLTGDNDQLDARIGRDGRLRPRNSVERREIAKKLIEDNPGATLREIAQRAHISPETARRVRSGLIQANGSVGASSPVLPGGPMPEVAGKKVLSMQWPVHAGDSRKSTRLKASSPWQSLTADPAFRATETGRSLLRMLSAYGVINEHGQRLIDQVPEHCVPRVVAAARECAVAWQELADRLEQQNSGEGGRRDAASLRGSPSPRAILNSIVRGPSGLGGEKLLSDARVMAQRAFRRASAHVAAAPIPSSSTSALT